MARSKLGVADPAFLNAALEGLELQRQRIEEQISYVKSLLGRKRSKGTSLDVTAHGKPTVKRELSSAARKRIAAAQKKRWAEYRKAKAAAARANA